MSENNDTSHHGGESGRGSISEDVTKDEESEETTNVVATKSNPNYARTGSISVSPSKQRHSDENLGKELTIEDAKKEITFSPSITDAVNDIVHPMREIQIAQVHKDHEQSILHKAIQRLREDFSKERAVQELMKMYDLYTSSLVDNQLLMQQCHELQDKTKQYEARHQWDPRVLRVLLIAERYRQQKADVDGEKSELEAEVLDASIELKHMDDVIKNKLKDIAKLQDELKKAKEIEKQVETLETQVLRKDQEISSLEEQVDFLQHAKMRLENAHGPAANNRQSNIGYYDETRFMNLDKDWHQKVEQLTSEKMALKAELDEKNKTVQMRTRRVSHLRNENNELVTERRFHVRTIGKLESDVNRITNYNTNLETKANAMRDQLTLAKSEIINLKSQLHGCNQQTSLVNHQLLVQTKANRAGVRNSSALNEQLTKTKKEHKASENALYIMEQETISKDRDIQSLQSQLSDKKLEVEHLSYKLFKLEQFRQRNVELIKLTRLGTFQMGKEIAELRDNLQAEKMSVQKAGADVQRTKRQIEALQHEYMDILDKNILLVRNHEMTRAAIERYGAEQTANERRIGHLMKTNIDLYTQTTGQQEIALIQSHQFHLKENEIKGLLSRLEEEDKKMDHMQCKDKEKRGVIEQLHTEANLREDKLKNLKSVIESYTQMNKSLSDRVDELTQTLRSTQTQKEMIRRQRDLFGTKLLQSKAETLLCTESLRTAKDTITTYSVDYFNMQNDIRVLKLEIKSLRRKLKLGDASTDLIHTLRVELGQTTKALELQKCKNAILEQTRMPAAHRWRGLLASDPSKFEMVLKNQILIKRLIGKSKEIAKLEELLKQKDTMYLSLRVLTQRRINTYLTPEMSRAKGLIRRQSRQLKSLTAEFNIAVADKKEAEAKEESHKARVENILKEKTRHKVMERKTQINTRLPPLGPNFHSTNRRHQPLQFLIPNQLQLSERNSVNTTPKPGQNGYGGKTSFG